MFIKTNTMFDCHFADVSISTALEAVEGFIAAGDRTYHSVGVNIDQLLKMKRNPEFAQTINSSDLVTADGQPVVWWSHIVGEPLPERVASIDLMYAIFEVAVTKGYKIFMLGAKPDVVRKARERYETDYSGLNIVGHHDGYFSVEDEPAIVKEINDAQTDVLLIAISSPKKEEFVARNQDDLQIPFALGVGGSFDIAAGLATRAPSWMRNAGLEWVWRASLEPRRMGRRVIDDFNFVRYLPGEFVRSRRRSRS